MFRRLVVLGFVMASVGAASAAEESRPNVALVTLLEVSENMARDLRSAASRSAQLQGATLVPHAYLRPGKDKCKGERTCWAALAAQSGATHVIFYSGTVEETTFALSTELWSAPAGEALTQVDKECGICSLKDLHKAVEDATTQLLARAEAAPLPVASPVPLPEAPVKQVPPPVYQQPAPMLGAALVAFGIVASVVSIVQASTDGDLVCQPQEPGCVIERKEAGSAPWIWGGLGLASIVGGSSLFFLTRRGPDEGGGMALGMAGRF